MVIKTQIVSQSQTIYFNDFTLTFNSIVFIVAILLNAAIMALCQLQNLTHKYIVHLSGMNWLKFKSFSIKLSTCNQYLTVKNLFQVLSGKMLPTIQQLPVHFSLE